MHLLLATKNRGKIEEIQISLRGLDIDFESLPTQGDLSEPTENGSTFGQNARIKAEHYYRLSGIPALADDSGLVIDVLQGAPGVRSARFAPTDERRIEKLLRKLGNLGHAELDRRRTARFICALCLYLPGQIIEVEGTVEGQITEEPCGSAGFGYDPIFYYPPLDKTFGEMSSSQKSTISHRGRALQELRFHLAQISHGM